MEPRIKFTSVNPGAYKAMLGLETYLGQCGLDKKLLDLLRFRVSQINGCAYCLDMHWKELMAAGETEQRLYGLDAWRESPRRRHFPWLRGLTLDPAYCDQLVFRRLALAATSIAFRAQGSSSSTSSTTSAGTS